MGIPKEISRVIGSERFDSQLRHRIEEWSTEEIFSQFLFENVKKITKKLKGAEKQNREDQRDVGLELFVARAFLLAGCKVKYEPESKGPDFSLELENESYFCEVRRIRENLSLRQDEWLGFNHIDFRKIGAAICEELLQLRIGHPNIIYVRSNRFLEDKIYLKDAITSLLGLANARNTTFFSRKGFDDDHDFLNRSSFCSAIILEDLWARSNSSDTLECIYLNKQARYPLSQKMLEVIAKAIDIPFQNKFTNHSSA